ncbi:hypothetical protein WG907_16625 [Sphingobium sp. AN558]|uniref:hypothetical protein n=1 Tax=Sphingobium sp. AN558 TaxID=3133442 RepID=UPI0030C5925B
MRPWMLMTPLLLAGCAGAYQPEPLTQKQAAKLEKALAGLTPGDKVSCINRSASSSLTVISGNVLLYRSSGRLIYRNDLIGSCSGLNRGDTLITQSSGLQLCRGDMARSADLTVGIPTGACALGDFTPYRKPR